jgi:hypothetical protein
MKPKVLAISYLLAVVLGQTPKPANDNGLRLTRPRLSAMRTSVSGYGGGGPLPPPSPPGLA